MGQEYLMFLLGFEVELMDRRNDEEKKDFVVVPYQEAELEDPESATDKINRYYGRLGYDVLGIEHKESKVLALDLQNEYNAATTTDQYWEDEE